MRAYIVIGTLAVLALFAFVYMAIHTRSNTRRLGLFSRLLRARSRLQGGEQHSIDDEDYCPDGNFKSFYEGCIAYVRGMADQADNGIGVGTLINPDADDDDDNK